MAENKLKIVEIFTSIDGEVNKWGQGCFTTFIRLWGCNLQCNYCDTTYAMKQGNFSLMSVMEIINAVNQNSCDKVTITGGEPLLNPAIYNLIKALHIWGYKVSIETNGSIFPDFQLAGQKDPIRYERLSWIFDYKLSSSGMNEKMLSINTFAVFPSNSFIKLVIGTDEDFDEALKFLYTLKSPENCYEGKVAFSPCIGDGYMTPERLTQKMIDSKLFDIIMNLQIHKFIFPNGENSVK